MSRIIWNAEVECEYGGPVIIADALAYEHWSGSNPYPREFRKALHYWGQFTAELPEPYRAEGGHVVRPAQSFEALEKDRDALIEAVKSKFEGAMANFDDKTGEAMILLPDFRTMQINFSPESAYHEACEAGSELWSHRYRSPRGHEGSALFWDKEGAGAFWVGMTESRDELVLLRTWVDDDAFDADAKARVDTPGDDETAVPEVELTVDDGAVIVAYSPQTWLSILGNERIGKIVQQAQSDGIGHEQRSDRIRAAFRALYADAEGTQAVQFSAGESANIAAGLSLRPGTYRAAMGRYEHDSDDSGWSCVWCRLRRVTATPVS